MRKIPADLVRRYRQEGWWTEETLGDLLTRGLADRPGTHFEVHSAVRPYTGTFGSVERLARRLAAGLRERGVGPGDVVAFQLPNWREAAAVFWAAAFLGAVVVPIVHFYGARELRYILTASRRSEEHTSELQSRGHLVCRLLLEKKKREEYIPVAIMQNKARFAKDEFSTITRSPTRTPNDTTGTRHTDRRRALDTRAQ